MTQPLAATHRRGAPLQPLLHAADRRAAQNLSRQPLLARRDARALRDRPRRARTTASDIGRALDLDAGYLRRVLRNFEKRGLITRKTSRRRCAPKPSRADRARRQDLRAAREALAARGRRHARQARAPTSRRGWSRRWQTIETLLGGKPRRRAASRATSCARRGTAISAGSSPATPSSTRRNTAGANRSRACARRSSPTSSTTTIRSASAAGSPRWTARTSAASCW